MEQLSRTHRSPPALSPQTTLAYSQQGASKSRSRVKGLVTSKGERKTSSTSNDSDLRGHPLAEQIPAVTERKMAVFLDGVAQRQATGLRNLAIKRGRGNCEDLMEALYSPAGGIAAALRSVASQKVWGGDPGVVSPVPQPSVTSPDQDQAASAPSSQTRAHQDISGDPGDTPEKNGENSKETLESSINSKYIHNLPLYQDYWLECVRTELHRMQGGGLSELVATMRLEGLLSSPAPTQEPPPFSCPSSVPRLLQDSRCLLWQDLPAVRERGLQDKLTPKERCLQEAMFELIGSEASYLKSLLVAVSHFLGSEKLKMTLPKVEHHVLFSNLADVKKFSERFLMDLETRLGESIVIRQVGDLVLRHHAELRRVYVPYITNMMYQEALVSRLTQENREFLHVLKKLEKAPVCQRQSLKSFLVLPFQRITRLRIILENILKLMPSNSDSAVSLKEAISAVHQILMECNDGVRCMKRTEELVRLEKLIDFRHVKSIPFVSRGRYLIQKGALRQLLKECPSRGSRVSFRDIYLHLFSDLLLLSSREAERFRVLDYAPFPAPVQVEQLKTQAQELPANSFLLRLSENHTKAPAAYVLVAHTSLDREAWISVLSSHKGDVTTLDH